MRIYCRKDHDMKNTRLLAMIAAALMLSAALLLAACDKDDAPGTEPGTQAPDVTSADTTNEESDAPTQPAVTEADTPAETPPAETEPVVEETTEEETVFTPPTPTSEDAAAAGLPLDSTAYTVGGESPEKDPTAQYDYLKVYAHAYENKSFTVYGNVTKDDKGNILVLVGDNRGFAVYFDGVSEPVIGSYVKVTATFAKTVDRGAYVDFDCFTMLATSCETLGEAQAPNGGRYMFITASSLNVRTSSDTSSSDNILGTLSQGDMVEVFEQDAKGWYRIIFKGQNAYISNKYVSETKP